MNDVDDILTFGLYGRIFNLDEIVAELEEETYTENIFLAVVVGLLIFIVIMKFC
jgi:hypothetical protein